MTRFGHYNPITDVGLTVGMRASRDVYIAAPFFTNAQAAEVAAVETWLNGINFEFFSPRLECRYVKGAPNEILVAQRAFWLNRHHISNCMFVLAGLTFPDVGTAWELGFADSKHIPRMGWTGNARVAGNLMICGTVDAVVPFGDLKATLGALQLDVERGKTILGAVRSYDNLDYWQKPEE